MAQAIAADLAALPEVQLTTTRDSRLPPLHSAACQVRVIRSSEEEQRCLAELARLADWTILIAPETDHVLLDRARLVEAAGGRLLSPPSEIVQIAANKQQTAEWLVRHGVPMPAGQLVQPGQRLNLDFPQAVLKPVDGCGSQYIRHLNGRREIEAAIASLPQPMRLEAYVPGQAASVAVLCGPQGHVALPACAQHLSSDGCFTYRGGRTPLPMALDKRARQLALAVAGSLPQPVGYLGVDLVLGDDDSGAGDAVIEINPRLTTSYTALRVACRGNLAAAMLAVALGRPTHIEFDPQPLEFSANGTVRPRGEQQPQQPDAGGLPR